MSGTDPVLLDPPHWPGLGNDQLAAFVEAVNNLLDAGIFRPQLAAELASYRDAAGQEISARIAGLRAASRDPARAGDARTAAEMPAAETGNGLAPGTGSSAEGG